MILPNKKGITLVASIMLMVFASVAVLGVATFIIQRLSQTGVKEIDKKALYLAQAGIQSAIYNFRFQDTVGNGYFSLGQTNIDDSYFVLGASSSGGDAGLLMVDLSASVLTGSKNNLLEEIYIQNATNSQPIIIERMIVSWDTSPSLRRIRINGKNVWTGNLASPVDADISDFTLDIIPTRYAIDYFRFDKDMTGSTVNVQFVMTGGSIKDVTVFPASNNYNFSVESTGKIAGSSIYHTIHADYNAIIGNITNYYEVNTEIMP
ncbi:MAG: hypothetical protein KAJ18_03095 [Candidatus Omnitrophica bacterium]|nr:hypothetical protein [Candidatus Omnitrophota bacterium]